MSAISADVLELEKMSLQDWPRLERLRKAHFATNSEICLELARNTTDFFKKEKREPMQRDSQDYWILRS